MRVVAGAMRLVDPGVVGMAAVVRHRRLLLLA